MNLVMRCNCKFSEEDLSNQRDNGGAEMMTMSERLYAFKVLPELLKEEFSSAAVDKAVEVTRRYAETSGGEKDAVIRYLRAMAKQYHAAGMKSPTSKILI